MANLPADVYEEIESRDGKTYTGEALKELRKKDRQEKVRKQLEKDAGNERRTRLRFCY
jgi:hypothetical protein